MYYYKLIKDNSPTKQGVITTDKTIMDKSLLSYYTSNYTGWTLILATSEKDVLSPLYRVIRNLLLASLIILILSVFLSYFFAGKISKPINNLRRTIRSFDLDNETVEHNLHSDINEIEELNEAFIGMSSQLKNSLNKILAVQQQEMQSKMLALQSQMNPHFLYNTLSVISVMAEESMDDEIIEMCSNISDILRFISSDSSPLVELQHELDIARKYLDCLTFRHSGKLYYTVDVPSDLLEVKVPKLSIQPLVENAIKYMSKIAPPWNVSVVGKKTESGFIITVSDNGGGFNDEDLKRLREKIAAIDNNLTLPSLELDGMGILNLYIRLKLSYKEKTFFELKNNPNGGASITFGLK